MLWPTRAGRAGRNPVLQFGGQGTIYNQNRVLLQQIGQRIHGAISSNCAVGISARFLLNLLAKFNIVNVSVLTHSSTLNFSGL